MEIVLIDTFVVPDESKAEFLETSRAIQDVLKRLPGFVEGFLQSRCMRTGRVWAKVATIAGSLRRHENAVGAIPDGWSRIDARI